MIGRHAWRLAASVVLSLAVASPAAGQVLIRKRVREVPRTGAWEVSAGAVWLAGFDLEDRTAALTRNSTTDTSPFEQFTTTSRLAAATGVQGRLAYYVTRSVAIEAGARYAKPTLAVRITGDAEQAADVTAEEKVSHYVFDGSVVVHLPQLSFASGRAVPFFALGAGYVRELHEGDELVETGTEYHGGAGLKVLSAPGARRSGLRVDVGISSREGGLDLPDRRSTQTFAAVSLLYLF
ncbi:MAG: hypothetical protein LC753_01890 [Acidobacteria bacterium]|nr:hypothetical protein [Acidobacteriota bacterium]MCA1649057.1 hypothetical protein [Acidobacteriota bacterium]